jgi:tryptophan halogenase
MREASNDYHARNWDLVRRFLAVHYKFNTRLDTPYWVACRNDADLAGAERIVEFYKANGPNVLAQEMLLEKFDQFGLTGYYAMLLGQRVPHDAPYVPTAQERTVWERRASQMRGVAAQAMTVREALDVLHSPAWQWHGAPPTPVRAAG